MIVYTEWRTLLLVRQNGLSLSRLGDGEAKILRGVGCKTQPADPELTKRMRRLLANPDPRVMVCLPRIWPDEPPLATPGFWPQFRSTFETYAKPDHAWGSSFVTRRDAFAIPHERVFWCWMQWIWRGRPVLLITGSNKGRRFEAGLLSTAATVELLGCPQQGAWSQHERLRRQALEWGEVHAAQRPVVVLACGSAATVLAHELGIRGLQALDLGHAAQAHARQSPKTEEEP